MHQKSLIVEQQNILKKHSKHLLTYSLFFLLIFIGKAGAQVNYSSGITVRMNGYVVNVGGQILFQPCEDSTLSVLESLDNTSFVLEDFYGDLYLEAIGNLGDSVFSEGRFLTDKNKYSIKILYFYCLLEVDMMFLDTSRFKVHKKPKYELTYEGNTYFACGFSVDNRIKRLIPGNEKNLLLMYHYYADKGYVVPKWLEALVREKKKKNKKKINK